MKEILISFSIAALLFTACSGNQSKEPDQNEATHQHDDGSVHGNHQEDTTSKQEEFIVPNDTTSQKAEKDHGHSHDEHDHPHKHN